MKTNFKFPFTKLRVAIAALVLITAFALPSCKKTVVSPPPPTDAEILINKRELRINTQENLDIEKMILVSGTGFDLSFLSGNTFGSNSEFTFGTGTTQRKIVTTNSSLFDGITQLEQLKTTINSNANQAWTDNAYNLEPNYNSIPSKFISFKTRNGKLCLIRINPYNVWEDFVDITLLIQK
jgi:hypothetical protein